MSLVKALRSLLLLPEQGFGVVLSRIWSLCYHQTFESISLNHLWLLLCPLSRFPRISSCMCESAQLSASMLPSLLPLWRLFSQGGFVPASPSAGIFTVGLLTSVYKWGSTSVWGRTTASQLAYARSTGLRDPSGTNKLEGGILR